MYCFDGGVISFFWVVYFGPDFLFEFGYCCQVFLLGFVLVGVGCLVVIGWWFCLAFQIIVCVCVCVGDLLGCGGCGFSLVGLSCGCFRVEGMRTFEIIDNGRGIENSVFSDLLVDLAIKIRLVRMVFGVLVSFFECERGFVVRSSELYALGKFRFSPELGS